MRQRLFQITRQAQEDDFPSQVYDLLIVVISCLSIVPLMFRSTDLLESFYGAITYLELATVYIILFDYVLGWITSDYLFKSKGWKPFARYPFTLPAIIEILSILPSLGVVPSWLRILRLFMLVRLVHYSRPLLVVSNVVRCQKRSLLSVFYVTLIYTFASALFMFLCEPEMFVNFFEAMYWSVTAVTTIGYGDIVPTTELGRLVGMISSVVGIAVIALPSGIVTAGYMEQLAIARRKGESYYANTVSLKRLRKRFLDAISIPKKGFPVNFFQFIKKYWLSHRVVRVTVITMVICMVVNEGFYLLASKLGMALWLDMVGTAIAAVLLEPAAGIIVGFVNNLILSIHQGNETTILFFLESALTAIAFGFYFHLSKVRSAKSIAMFIFVAVILEAAGDMFLHLLFPGFVVDQPWETKLRIWCTSLGSPLVLATFFECLVSKAIDIIAVSMIAAFGIGLVRDTRFDPRAIIAQENAKKVKDDNDAADDQAVLQDDHASLAFEAIMPFGLDGQVVQPDDSSYPSNKADQTLPANLEIEELSQLILAWAEKKKDLEEGRITPDEYESWKAGFIPKL